MLIAELQELEEVKNLVAKGHAEGVIAYGEVATALAEVDVDESDIEELYGYLEGQGVEMVDDVDPAQASSSPTSVWSSRSPRITVTRACPSST